MKPIVLVTLLLSSLAFRPSAPAAPPNILFIFSDDHAPSTWPKGGPDGPFDAYQPSGTKTVAEAITLSAMK